jgi:hypothetical protein
MNVVVNRAHVVGIALDHGFERGDDFFSAGFRSSVAMPQAPGVQVHAGFREQRSGIEIVRKVLRDFAHGVVIGLGCLPAIGLGIRGETQRHGLDVGLFDRRSSGREIDSLLNGGMRRHETLVTGGIIVVWADCLGHPPIRHGKLGIEVGAR